MTDLTDEQIHRNRRRMTILHFVLTYPRWSLSLFLLLASRSLTLPSSSEAVRQPLAALQVMAGQESQFYRNCVTKAFDTDIPRSVNATVDAELTRIANLRNMNEQRLTLEQARTQSCTIASQQARRALQVWQRLVELPLVTNETTCTAQDRDDLKALLGQDYSLAEASVTGAFDRYRLASLASLDRIADYAEARAAYDYDYFIGVHLAQLQVELQGFHAELDLSQLSLLDDLLGLINVFLDALRLAQVRIDLLNVRLGEFYASIDAFYINYIDLYGRLSLAADFVADFLPSGVPLPDFLDLTGIPTADLLLPPIFALPQFDVDLPSVDDLLSDYIEQLIELLARVLAEIAETTEEQVRRLVEEILERLRQISLLEDYDPPRFVGTAPNVASIDDELRFLANLGDATRQQLVAAFEQARGLSLGLTAPNVSAPSLNFSGPTLDVNSTTTFGYLEPRFPSISIPALVQVLFAWILARQWIIELVVQFFRLLKLKRRYERNALPELPEIDYLEEEETSDEQEQRKVSTLSLLQVAILKHFLTPWMALGLILLPFALLGVTVWFPHVRARCVYTRTGTVIGRNLVAPLVINKANLVGNSLYTAGELQCRNRLRRVCNQHFSETDTLQRSDEAFLFALDRQQNLSMQAIHLLDRCVETQAVDDAFAIHCCGLDGYGDQCLPIQDEALCPIDNATVPPSPFRLLGEYLVSDDCDFSLQTRTLADARFDCNVLSDSCRQVPCASVDENLLRMLAIETDCHVEVYVIKCCILVLVAIYHAVLVNLCTTLAFSAIKHLQWRSLRPDGIRLRTRLTATGDLVKGADRDERRQRIDAAMRRFELVGWVQLAIAIVIFVVWLFSFFVLRHSLSDFNNV